MRIEDGVIYLNNLVMASSSGTIGELDQVRVRIAESFAQSNAEGSLRKTSSIEEVHNLGKEGARLLKSMCSNSK